MSADSTTELLERSSAIVGDAVSGPRTPTLARHQRLIRDGFVLPGRLMPEMFYVPRCILQKGEIAVGHKITKIQEKPVPYRKTPA
jgi:hypothetical protein